LFISLESIKYIEDQFDDEALRAKDDIDVRIESLKAELDNFRDKLHEDIDNKKKDLKKYKIKKFFNKFSKYCFIVNLGRI